MRAVSPLSGSRLATALGRHVSPRYTSSPGLPSHRGAFPHLLLPVPGPPAGVACQLFSPSLPCCPDFSDEGHHGKLRGGWECFPEGQGERKRGGVSTPLPLSCTCSALPVCRAPCAGCSLFWSLGPVLEAWRPHQLPSSLLGCLGGIFALCPLGFLPQFPVSLCCSALPSGPLSACEGFALFGFCLWLFPCLSSSFPTLCPSLWLHLSPLVSFSVTFSAVLSLSCLVPHLPQQLLARLLPSLLATPLPWGPIRLQTLLPSPRSRPSSPPLSPSCPQ